MEKNLLFELVREELCDVAGDEGVDTSEASRFCYNADYSWVSRVWVDHGQKPMLPDFIVFPELRQQKHQIFLARRFFAVKAGGRYPLSVFSSRSSQPTLVQFSGAGVDAVIRNP